MPQCFATRLYNPSVEGMKQERAKEKPAVITSGKNVFVHFSPAKREPRGSEVTFGRKLRSSWNEEPTEDAAGKRATDAFSFQYGWTIAPLLTGASGREGGPGC